MTIALAGEALLDLLSPEVQARLASKGQRKAYRDSETIHQRGDDEVGMGIVIAGRVRLTRLHADGTQTFVSVVHKGQHYGDVLMFDASQRRSYDAVASGDVVIDHYDAAAFHGALELPDVIKALYRITAQRLVGVMAMNDDLRSLPRDVHLAKMLVVLARKSPDGQSLRIVQEDLAALLGATPVTISKGLAALKRAGLIEVGYRHIGIVDHAALKQWMRARLAG